MIDYGRLERSLKYYGQKGYERIETPWTVSKYISNLTKPKDGKDWTILEKDKVLVASGEQSFLYLYLKNFLPKGKFMTITPCFREENFDNLHTKYFIKNELIITDEISKNNLKKIISDAKLFFEKELNCKTQIKRTKIGFDIEYKGLELGSYGIRKCEFLKWIYGTGLAEPRLTFIKNKIKNNGLS